MVTMHPLAFVAANAVSLVSSASNSNSGNKGEMASQEAAASALVLEESSAPINPPLLGAKKSIQVCNAIPTIISIDTPPLHFVFIVHGHQGRPADLSYMHHTIRAKAKAMGKFVDVRSSESCTVGRIKGIHSAQQNSGKIRRRKRDRIPAQIERALDPHYDNYHLDPNFIPSTKNEQARGSLIVHNAACNEGKTHDGIIKGGERLVDEMLSIIRSEVKRERNNQRDPVDITISIVGNSLGGLYGRYAIAFLAEILDNDEFNDYYLFDGFIRVHFNVFCSTSSPHLGCASFTYIPIPRTVEMGVAQIMGETGSDLFRRNDLLQSMATSPRFLVPLASFQRRIAYANAFGTDFPVPGSTAAFLAKDSDYPHYFGDMLMGGGTTNSIETEEKCPASERGLIAATLYTLPQDHNFDADTTMDDDLTTMSACLDRLGWKKVFVDIRKEIPSLPILNSGGSADCPLRQLKTLSSEVRSCDLAKAISSSSSHRISLPLGHNAICAFSRGKVSSIVNSGGRPVMDSLAIDLTNVISMWNCELSRRHVK